MFIIFDKMQEQNEFLKAEHKIKLRTIKHGKISKASVNKNCPKFIVGNCWYLYQQEIIKMAQESEIEHLQESFKKTQSWIHEGFRDRFNLANLTHLFGEGQRWEQKRRNYSNSKALYRLLSKMALQIIARNKKVEKPLSYLICLEKLTARLANPALVHKLQFK